MIAVALKGLRVRRAGRPIIDALDLDILPAGWTGIVGANGSGKTTLLRALAGRIPVDAGTIHVNGSPARSRLWLAEHIGFAPDIAALPHSLTGSEILDLMAERSPAATEPLESLRSALGIDALKGRRIGSMSAGMRQRIALYAAFVTRSDVVVLDEPFNWLDPVCAHDTRKALSDLVRDTGTCLVTALHDISTLTVFCDSGILLSDGRIVQTISKENLRFGAKNIAQFESEIIQSLRSL